MTELSLNWTQFQGGPGYALALHCGLAHCGAWHGVSRHLTDQVTIWAPDLPGHGRSADWDGTGDVNHRILEALAPMVLPGTHLIGHSYGAVLALRLAQELSDRVASLTLIEPVLFAAARQDAPDDFAVYSAKAAPFARAMEDGDWLQAARKFTSLWGAGDAWEALAEAQRQRMTRQMRLIAASQSCLLEDSLNILRPGGPEACEMPVLLVRGGATDTILENVHAALMARLPNARETVIEGAGHMVPISHPDQVGPAISGHIGSAL